MSELVNICSFDSETHLLRPGLAAPPYICASMAHIEDGRTVGQLLHDSRLLSIYDNFIKLLNGNRVVAYANAAFDLCVMMERHPDLKWDIFKALREGRIHDVLIAESLHGIANGTLGLDPRTGGELRSPSTGKVSKRYSLELVTAINLNRTDAKAKDHFRKSYALLEGIPVEHWPDIAREYPIEDAKNTLDVAIVQRLGKPAQHAWNDSGLCDHCGMSIPFGEIPPCLSGKRGPAHLNLGNLPQQVEADFALKLGSAWGLRTDPERVEKLSAEVEVKHAVAVERFQKKGWIREDGTEDQRAVKQAIVRAYGGSAPCKRCNGSGKVRAVKIEECRGIKVKGRYQGCLGNRLACICNGAGQVEKLGNEINCKNIFDEADVLVQEGCDGTGFELSSLPMLPRSESQGVKTDRDAKMESGDDDLGDYAEDESEKLRTTIIPFLRKGFEVPLSYNPNVLLWSGRASLEGSPMHQLPRKGGARECIRARGPWCGSPVDYTFVSTDYAAGELCALAQVTYWYEGESRMLQVINATKDPGALHTVGAALMLGISSDEAIARLKAGDKLVKEYRQAFKCFHPDTEILTRRRGWVRMADLTMDDDVASVIPHEERPAPVERIRDSKGRFPPAHGPHKTRREWAKQKIQVPSMEIVWTKPIRLTTRKATEGLLHLKNQSIDLRVTPDHRMLTYGGTRLLKTVEARDFGKQRGWFNAGMWNGGSAQVDERLLRLAVAVQADGTYISNGKVQKYIRLGFSKQRKIDRLSDMLFHDEYERKIYANGKYKPTTWFKLNEDLSTKLKALLDVDKTLPWWWIELTPTLRQVVLDEAKFWDAHQGTKMKCYHFVSTLKKNAEVLQTIASITNRKAVYNREQTRESDKQATCHTLSIKTKHDTRGENVKVTKLDYDGDVYCLTVPSDCVLVRDGGIPVITRQCASFGFPGGLGSATLVLTNRRKAAGTTKLPSGEEVAGIRFCVLIGGAERCGIEKVIEWNKKPCPPVCKACVKLAEEILKPAFFETYPEVKKYLNRISAMTNADAPIPSIAWNAERGEVEVLRLRGKCGYTDGANQGFQGLMSDICKRAYVKVTRESYLGVRDDGPPSVLAGSRHPLFFHDEIFSEIPRQVVHPAAHRVGELMVESGHDLAPDVHWRADPCAMDFWSKDAAETFVNGELVAWQPKEKAA